MEVSEGVLEFKDPFDFFQLDILYQEDYLLKSDLESIKNLCNAAALSKEPGAVDFFRGVCNDYKFWRKKFRQDFPELFEEALRVAEGEGIDDQVRYWREEYMIEALEEAKEKMSEVVTNGDAYAVKKYLDLGVDPNLPSDFGGTILIDAAKGPVEIVQILLNAGAKVNEQDRFGNTALISASGSGNAENIGTLLEAGAKVNLGNKWGYTPLMIASGGGGNANAEIVQMLLKSGANPNIQRKDKETALIEASRNGNPDVVELLLVAGADPAIRDKFGRTALQLAFGFPEVVKVLKRWARWGPKGDLRRREKGKERVKDLRRREKGKERLKVLWGI